MMVKTAEDTLLQLFSTDQIGFIAEPEPTAFYSTGSLMLDFAWGGGLPVGRWTVLWGESAYGKTTLALLCARAVIERGGYVAYVDTEAAIDPIWAGRFGLDVNASGKERRMWLLQPQSAEKALNAMRKMVKWKHPTEPERSAFDLIILDSIAALATEAELAGDIGDKTIASRASVLAQYFKSAKVELANSTTAVLMLNQQRDKFGQASFAYGPSVHMPGGHSPKFYSSIIAKVAQKPVALVEKETGKVYGLEFKVRTTKNKVGRNGREATITVFLDTGTADIIAELATLGKELGVFTKEDGSPIKGACAWYFTRDHGREKVGVGEKQVTMALEEDRDLAAEVEAAVRYSIANLNKADANEPIMALDTEPDDVLEDMLADNL